MSERREILLGVCGSASAHSACEIVTLLKNKGFSVKVAATPAALEFINVASLRCRSGKDVLIDIFDDSTSPTPHVYYPARACAYLIAPATANTIAKLACGIADDAVCACALAADCKKIVAPAMNTHMYLNEATQNNLETLKNRGYEIIEPVVARLACGVTGIGHLAPVDEIVRRVLEII